MLDKPKLIFDVMDSETEPTDEQLEELMRHVGERIRAETAEIKAMVSREMAKVAESSPHYGSKS